MGTSVTPVGSSPHSATPVATSDHDLLSAYRSGSQQAADQIYQRYRGRVVRFINRSMGQPLKTQVESDDVMQWVFAHTFTEIREATSTLEISGHVWPLLAAIAGNVINSHARFWSAQRRDPRRTEPLSDSVVSHPDESPESLAAMKEVTECLLSAFPSQHRKVLELIIQGHSAAEIATTCGVSGRTIYRIRKAAERVLRRHLSESGRHSALT
jgi:RNA polymerase sigma factor (sigma-70 family)